MHPMPGELSTSNRDIELRMRWEQFVTVAMSDTLAQPVLNRVIHDHYASILLAMDSLTRRGYQRIGFCMTEDMDLRVNQRWQAGFRVYRANHPIARIEPLILKSLDPDNIQQWINDEHLDAIIGASLELPLLLKDLGLQVGRDIAYADLDLNPGNDGHKGISGIDQNSKMLGIAAIDLLISGIHRNQRGIPKIPLTVQVEGVWKSGKSTPKKT